MSTTKTSENFSPSIRAAIARGLVEDWQLRRAAGISRAAMSRYKTGERQIPEHVTRRWAESKDLPDEFRVIVRNWRAGGRDDAMEIPKVKLDTDGDGETTIRDAQLLQTRVDRLEAERSAFWLEAMSDGRITAEEAARDQQYGLQLMAMINGIGMIWRYLAASAAAMWRRS